MGKFKVDDKVRVVRHRNLHGDHVEHLDGKIVTIKGISNDVKQVPEFTLFVTECGWLVRSDDIEPVTEGPVRTVTRKEIVSGVYGRIVVTKELARKEPELEMIRGYFSAKEIRETIATLTELADALDEA